MGARVTGNKNYLLNPSSMRLCFFVFHFQQQPPMNDIAMTDYL